ncbi:MAG: hypothetical protein ACE5I7_08130 [Candidatus Binatia bacterium]
MSLEDDVRRCCDEVEGVHKDAQRVKQRCCDEAKKDLSAFEERLEQARRDVHAASETLNRGVRQELEAVVSGWRNAHERLAAHLRLIEAKSFLAAARRLAGEGDFVGAKNELAAAMDDAKEARALMPGKDVHLAELTRGIERAVEEIHAEAEAATDRIEEAVAHNERLLEDLKQAS